MRDQIAQKCVVNSPPRDVDIGGEIASTSMATTDADHCNAACELGQPLLQLLTIVVGSGFLDLRLE
jgi:hypothetical protein